MKIRNPVLRLRSSARIQPAASSRREPEPHGRSSARLIGIPEQAVTGSGAADEVAGDIDLRQDAMQPRQQQVGQQHPEHHEQQQGPAGSDALRSTR